jgi:hypothetical protein
MPAKTKKSRSTRTTSKTDFRTRIIARLVIRHRQLKQESSTLYDANKVASLNAYLGNVSFAAICQLEDNDYKLPSYFVIPPPIDAAHYIVAKDLLNYLALSEFDPDVLPEIRWHRGTQNLK